MNSQRLRAALYARVSSEQQAKDNTIASQLAALKERIKKDRLQLEPELCFVDEGYSGSTLIRPALERLRDQVAAGTIDRLYVHSPDRLARKYRDPLPQPHHGQFPGGRLAAASTGHGGGV
jgi:site-specific DNA recombinase